MRAAYHSPNGGMSVFEIQAISAHLCSGVFPLHVSAYAALRELKASTFGTSTQIGIFVNSGGAELHHPTRPTPTCSST